MGLLKEFKEFAMRGSVVDMAVGVVIGAAFGKIVSSLVADVIMPPVGVLLGGVDFSDLAVTIQEASRTVEGAVIPAVVISYGKFIQTVIDFSIIAAAIFGVIKLLSSFKKKTESVPEAPPAPSSQELLLAEIRDLLKNRP
ncbi:MAG: large-conductance mechanosensitive channel protein MscL [Methylomonas sp.]|nr:large-conductance mechanosensitive channel protein MscL [Methylomonas sp.]PPD20507.1 MAG: large conductance mechanosensitive channel protein MscL [Methylomonas sp.]PPD26814.1 MAG: large conductance mechanosensitive channel protein MscL [Methylomonas sp.]PPD38678.1 MAG: large conductance mechanosensitive channel protein MscL [Methylomonas sp.]PPD40811.1 MAG: large conductance mechanosensitive channel protein MscL [Methylomonas sp.]